MAHLNALVVDDSADDAVLLLRALRRGGYEVESRVAATRADVGDALASPWDVIVIDHNLPGFSGMEALALARAADPDVPVLVVSGSVGEDAAVAAMKAGAQDFILKDNLSRFVPAVERELREAAVRRQARRADDALQTTIELLERTVQGAIQTLAFLAETRDPYTAGHQRRVTELAEAIAGAMGVNGERRRLIMAAGTLHDLGKTAVPTEILTKPGRLTAAELELIRVHPTTGYETLPLVDRWIANRPADYWQRCRRGDGLRTAAVDLCTGGSGASRSVTRRRRVAVPGRPGTTPTMPSSAGGTRTRWPGGTRSTSARRSRPSRSCGVSPGTPWRA